MKLLLLTLLFPIVLVAQQRSSADYEVTAESNSATGAASLTSTNYRADVGTAFSGGSFATSLTYANKTGFVGQLYDVVDLQLASAQDPVPEASSVALSANILMDDDTLLGGPDTVQWNVLSGPVSAVDASGNASTTETYAELPATVEATFAGITRQLGFTIEDTISDNFGLYGGDDLSDQWQVTHFGTPPSANGTPDSDPDGDGNINLKEFLSGHDPMDPTDSFHFEIQGKNAGTVFIELDQMIPGTNYHLFFNDDLSGPWTLLQTFTVGTTTQDAIIQDTAAPLDRGFYRLTLEKQ